MSGGKCVDYDVEGVRPIGMPKKTWSDVTEKEQARKICKDDAIDRRKQRTLEGASLKSNIINYYGRPM